MCNYAVPSGSKHTPFAIKFHHKINTERRKTIMQFIINKYILRIGEFIHVFGRLALLVGRHWEISNTKKT